MNIRIIITKQFNLCGDEYLNESDIEAKLFCQGEFFSIEIEGNLYIFPRQLLYMMAQPGLQNE